MKRAVILVLDSLGIGATEDAGHFGDQGANTLGHIAKACHDGIRGKGKKLQIPNLNALGLAAACFQASGAPYAWLGNGNLKPSVCFGFCAERSTGKDTPSGHWEMAGLPVDFEWGYFPKLTDTFPELFLQDLLSKTGLSGVMGNCHASGTEIIKTLGEEHMHNFKPIMYTSADSVIQIAAHEVSFGLNKLYDVCEVARELANTYNVGRIIARPFIGNAINGFTRTANRKDYTVPPHAETLLDVAYKSGIDVIGVGKIGDIFAHRGLSRNIKADGNEALFDCTLKSFREAKTNSLIMTNFVDFDMLYGHRRDIAGYANALEALDARLPELLNELNENDLLIVTADHGCDPSMPGSDHTREFVPFLMTCMNQTPVELGRRDSFSDIGQSVANFLQLTPLKYGRSVFST
ncbi:MAG TPA: phosphopentomutase [Arenimonas sp.]|nr:phosphopentomutase [Arenimonas sp.]